MKKSTQLDILNYIIGNAYGHNRSYGIVGAFKIYAQNEIESEEDIEKAPDEFCDFLMEHIGVFNASSEFELVFIVPNVIMMFNATLKAELDKEGIAEFVEVAKRVLPNGEKTNILEVAAGAIPNGAILMGKDHESVTAMDKFFIPAETLKKFNVNARDEYLDESTDVSGYEILLGNMPCEATNEIIKMGAKNNLPYMIRFCGCGLPQGKRRFEVAKDWKEQLSALDPRIKFFEFRSGKGPMNKFGYVSELPESEIEKIILSANHIESDKTKKSIRDWFFEIFKQK